MKTAIKDFIEKTSRRKTFLEHEIKEFLRGISLSTPNGIFVRQGEKIPEIKLKYPLIYLQHLFLLLQPVFCRIPRLKLNPSA